MASAGLDPWKVVYDTPFATAIRESEVVFPLLETIHVIVLALTTGVIVAIDLTLLGLLFRGEAAEAFETRWTPIVWVGFSVMALTGGLLLASEAAKLETNPAFLAKLGLLAATGLNLLVFRWARGRRAGAVRPPWLARASAGASLTLWLALIAAGRSIAYFH